MDYNLNQGQRAAADAFFEYLFDDNQNGFIISGAAGVGKTYLMGYIIDETMKRYDEMCRILGMTPQYTSVNMTATTNKAAEALGNATHRPTSTIHSFLNLKVFDDFETGVSKLQKNPRTWVVHENKIIFIDECSMIDKELFRIIGEGTHKCKIVYVGDHSQLAPVMEKLSPIYQQGYPFFELTEPMRNSGQPALMDICGQLRETVATGIFKPIKVVPGVIDYLDGPAMEQMITNHFMAQNPKERILAYTNKRVIQYNDHIRTMRGLGESLVQGDLLVNNSAITLGTPRGTMLSVEEGITVLRNQGPATVQIDAQHNVDLEIDYVDIQSDLGMIYGSVPVPRDKEHFRKLKNYYKAQKNWERFYYLKNGFPDFRPRDAATVHKSQGSTYETVFIDLADIATCTHADQAARMLYVAFSRPRSRVVLYGNPGKYGSIIV